MTRQHIQAVAVFAMLVLTVLLRPVPTTAASLISGYVLADQPTASSYTPSNKFQFNSSGALNTITRNSVGSYTVIYPNLGVSGGTALATAYGSTPATCKIGGWYMSGTTEYVVVLCFDTSGRPVDTYFSTMFSRPQRFSVAYVWADSPTAASYTPSLTYQFNPFGIANTITRRGTGYYDVQLPYMAGPAGGHVEITAYGKDSSRCKSAGWYASGTTEHVYVRCFTSAGADVDTYFTMTFVCMTSIDGASAPGSAYVWADSSTGSSYTPNLYYQFNSNGSTNVITRMNPGAYAVFLPSQLLHPGNVQVTAYGSGSEFCQPTTIGPFSWNGVDVQCFDSTGTPVDAYFDLSFTNDRPSW